MKAKKVYEAMGDIIPGKSEMIDEFKTTFEYWYNQFAQIIKDTAEHPRYYMDDEIEWDEYLDAYKDHWESEYFGHGFTPQEAADDFIEYIGEPVIGWEK